MCLSYQEKKVAAGYNRRHFLGKDLNADIAPAVCR
jgi:hypothetical protein